MGTNRSAALVATILLTATAAAASEAEVARVMSVSGNVLLSSESTITTANEAARLAPGTRVLATANGRAVIEFEGGCRLTVEPGQRLEIRADACGREERIHLAHK